jgi:DNA-binding NarL/FixJ family response regulator/PAS domain-containing protein
MHADRTLTRLVGLVYEAACDSTQWTTFMKELQRVLGTPWCFFYLHDLSRQEVDIHLEIGFDPAFVESYEAHYAAKNPTLTYRPHLLQPGRVHSTEALCPEQVFLQTEFHNEWALPQRLGQGLAGTVLRTPMLVGLFGVLWQLGAKPATRENIALLRALMPHLQRAVRVHGRLTELEGRARAATDALDHWAVGVILLDRSSRVLSVNRAAEEILRRRDGLTVVSQGLRAAYSHETGRLTEAIRDVIAHRPFERRPSGGVVTVSRDRASSPLELLIAPLGSQRADLDETRARCVVFVTDPAARPMGSAGLLQDLYGLTETEAKVASLLVCGKNVNTISDELSVTLNTTRTHVKRVLTKTNTRRQSELVGLLVRGLLSGQVRIGSPRE